MRVGGLGCLKFELAFKLHWAWTAWCTAGVGGRCCFCLFTIMVCAAPRPEGVRQCTAPASAAGNTVHSSISPWPPGPHPPVSCPTLTPSPPLASHCRRRRRQPARQRRADERRGGGGADQAEHAGSHQPGPGGAAPHGGCTARQVSGCAFGFLEPVCRPGEHMTQAGARAVAGASLRGSPGCTLRLAKGRPGVARGAA